MDKRLKNFLEKGIEEPGKAVEEFESAIANFIGRKYGIATDSATSALHLSLISLGIGKDDKVIIPSFVCVALLNAIKYVGAIPAVVDVEEDFNISVEKIERYLKKNKKVKAIIVPHMFGKNAKIEKIKKFGIPVIEDFTFTIGSKYKGKMSGKFGDISVCSFYYSKVLNAQKGGIFLTDNKNIYEKAKYLSFYDKKKKYEVSFNYRMCGIVASFGLYSFMMLRKNLERRKYLAEIYFNGLKDIDKIKLPQKTSDHIYSRFVVIGNENIRRHLIRRGVDAKKPIFRPIHSYLNLEDKNFPVTAYLFNNSFCLPLYHDMKKYEIMEIIEILKEVVKNV